MREIDIFDGHCDTVLMCRLKGGGLAKNPYHVDLERAGEYRRYAQFFALFGQPEDFPGLTFQEIFRSEYDLFSREMAANSGRIVQCRTAAEAEKAFADGKTAAFLSVEGAELLDCSLARLEEAHALGVRAVNPTWNRPNVLSGTNAEETGRGLSGQGKAFVRRAEELGVLVDVSHLSDPGFWDVAELLTGPFFASHSNSRQVFSHPRNLTDSQFTAIIDVSHLSDPGFWDVAELLTGPFFASHSNSRQVFSHPRNLTDSQFTAIIEHDGVAGFNLYADFVGALPDLEAVAAHLDHWLDLGGEKNIALGGDLDGCTALAGGMAGLQDYDRLYHFLLERGYGQALVQDLFFNNLMRVVSKVCTM